MNTENKLNKITEIIIGSAINIHRELGPGLLESAYEACLVYDLVRTGLKIEQQKPLSITYRGIKLDCAYRIDLLVDNTVMVEIKAIVNILPIHRAQLLSYLKLSNIELGLLINFNVEVLKDGIVRIINDFPRN